MKKIFRLTVFIVALFITSCEKDEGKLPTISFKTGSTYKSADITIPQGESFTIGISASKSEEEDVLKKFNISRKINGGASASIFNKDLSGTEGDNYSYDYTAVTDSVAGQTNAYIFTVTNRDGLTNQVSLTVTVQ